MRTVGLVKCLWILHAKPLGCTIFWVLTSCYPAILYIEIIMRGGLTQISNICYNLTLKNRKYVANQSVSVIWVSTYVLVILISRHISFPGIREIQNPFPGTREISREIQLSIKRVIGNYFPLNDLLNCSENMSNSLACLWCIKTGYRINNKPTRKYQSNILKVSQTN